MIGAVDDAVPARRLAFRWVSAVGDDDLRPSEVEITLEPSPVGTILRLRETRASTARGSSGRHSARSRVSDAKRALVDRVFDALADPTRRRIVERLGRAPATRRGDRRGSPGDAPGGREAPRAAGGGRARAAANGRAAGGVPAHAGSVRAGGRVDARRRRRVGPKARQAGAPGREATRRRLIRPEPGRGACATVPPVSVYGRNT